MKVPAVPGIGAEIDLDAVEPFCCFDHRTDA
jgi:hypothetical protein